MDAAREMPVRGKRPHDLPQPIIFRNAWEEVPPCWRGMAYQSVPRKAAPECELINLDLEGVYDHPGRRNITSVRLLLRRPSVQAAKPHCVRPFRDARHPRHSLGSDE